MGNMRRIPDGMDFSSADFAQEKDFGFSGSAQGYDEHPTSPPFAGSKPTDNGENLQNYAKGGEVKHGHPHGHKVMAVRHDPSTGAVVHHHEHGGYTMHHPDGHVTHHSQDGQHLAHGGRMMPPMGGEGTHVAKMAHMAPHHAGKPPSERPPRNPSRSASTPNEMPGGQMPYGVQPSAEPDEPDAGGGAPQLARGGRAKRREED